MTSVEGEENKTPETQAREALKAAGWISDGEDNWRPGPRARAPKVCVSAHSAVLRMAGHYANDWRLSPVIR